MRGGDVQGRLGFVTGVLLGAFVLGGCGLDQAQVQATGAGAVTDGTPPSPSPSASSFVVPAGFAPLSDETRAEILAKPNGMEIEDVDPAEFPPGVTPRQAAKASGALRTNDSPGAPEVLRRELAYARVTSDRPCQVEPSSRLGEPPNACLKLFDSRLAYVVALHEYGDTRAQLLGGPGGLEPTMATWLRYSIIDATTGKHLMTTVG